ncbi:MAG: pyruvate ferredoxin oxidoreductase [bacterium]|nr:pyruvate ferredoxin oxidoreductase [bacterium]
MYRIKLYGLGGQGVVTAAKILANAVCLHEDKYAKTVPAYGHERRGAPVYADVMISDEPILVNSFVYEPDVVMIFASSVIRHGVPVEKGIHKDTLLVINTGENLLEELEENYKFREIYYVDATQAALECIGKDIPNGAMLGAFAKTGIAGIDSITRALEENFKAPEGERNAKAARRAFERTNKKQR